MPSTSQRPSTPGRRERKKAETRAAIANAALELFLERGFEDVGIREIAGHADVAVATVFAHFPSKEALVFDDDAAVVASLVTAVVERPAGSPVLDALEHWFRTSARNRRHGDQEFTRFRDLVDRTPALHDYWQGLWRNHRTTLAHAVADSSDTDLARAELLATLVVEGYLLATEHDDTTATLDLLFRTLRGG